MTRLKPYAEYRESETEWLPPTPTHWRSSRVKYESSVALGKMLQPEAKSATDVLLPYVRAASVGQDGNLQVVDSKTMWFSPSDVEALRLVEGDILVVEGGDVGRSIILRRDQDGWGFQNSINRVRVHSCNNPRFLHYYLRSARSAGIIRAYCDAVSIPHLTAEKLGRLPVRMPPDAEQRTIADYLDRETSQIDALIGKQERLIERLRERRAAVISREVTARLASAPKQADDLPSEWVFIPFVRCMRGLVDYRGATPTKVDDGIQLLTARNVKQGWIDYETSREFIDPADYEVVMRRGKPRRGDLLFTMEAPLGNVALVDREDVALAQRVIKWRVNRTLAEPKYLLYAAMGSWFQWQLKIRATGSTALGIKASKLPELRVALPPLDEQRRIAVYLDEQTAKIDALIAKAERFIEVSKERRSALITAAVTGQIDVRDQVSRDVATAGAQSLASSTLSEQEAPV